MTIPSRSVAACLILVCCGLVVGAAIPLIFDLLPSYLAAVTVGCLLVQMLLVSRVGRITGRWLGVLPIVSVLWIIYYPLRLLRIQLDRHDLLAHPAVQHATDSELIWVWLVSTGGLAALLLGAWAVHKVKSTREPRIAKLSRRDFKAIAMTGLVTALVTTVAGVSSGVLANVGPLVLLGIAGLGFQDARRGRNSLWTISLVLVASLVGALAGFKELATLPVAAWGIGLLAGRRHSVKLRAVLLVALLGTFAFVGVAGQRIARPLGEPTDLPTASLNAMTRYDLESGTLLPTRKHGFEIVGDLAAGLSRRASGVEALIILHEAVPARTEFERGRTLILPALTVLPRSEVLQADSPFPTLSLGRYYSQTFYSLRPATDPSSQAMTWAGDLYLNFGTAGVILGLLVIGSLIGLVDWQYPPISAFNAGVLAYVGLAAIGLERNVAYVFVTVIVRLAIVGAVHWFLTARRPHPRDKPSASVLSGPAAMPVSSVHGHIMT